MTTRTWTWTWTIATRTTTKFRRRRCRPARRLRPSTGRQKERQAGMDEGEGRCTMMTTSTWLPTTSRASLRAPPRPYQPWSSTPSLGRRWKRRSCRITCGSSSWTRSGGSSRRERRRSKRTPLSRRESLSRRRSSLWRGSAGISSGRRRTKSSSFSTNQTRARSGRRR
ncbi:unnamed protein product [Ectocarpus fasciculatus]